MIRMKVAWSIALLLSTSPLAAETIGDHSAVGQASTVRLDMADGRGCGVEISMADALQANVMSATFNLFPDGRMLLKCASYTMKDETPVQDDIVAAFAEVDSVRSPVTHRLMSGKSVMYGSNDWTFAYALLERALESTVEFSQGKVPTKHVRLAVAFKTAEHYYALVGPVSFASMDDLTVFTSCIDWMQEAEG